jgi:glutaredoxin
MWWAKTVDPTAYVAPKGIPNPDSKREILLYQSRLCPYCVRVRAVVSKLGLSVPTADVNTGETRQTLKSLTGATQVPCLVIDGVPLLESTDISNWLEAYTIRGGKEA